MNLQKFNILVAVALLSMIGVVVMQVYWVQNAVQLKEEQFSRSVSIAMKSVLNRILELNTDITIKRLADDLPCNIGKTDITEAIPPRLLDSLLRVELGCMKIMKGYEYAVYNKANNKIVIGNSKDFASEIHFSEHQQSVEALFKPGSYYLSLYFPNQKSTVLKQLSGWMLLSAIFLLTVILSFWYTIFTVFRQKKLSEMKSDFINNMTHEFKTPISTISIAAEMLLKENVYRSEDRIKKYALVILNENKRLQQQAEQVLQSATLENGAIRLNLKKSDIHRLLNKIVGNFELPIKELSGKIETHFNADPIEVYVDRMHMTNVFANLIENAIKYSANPPEISINTNLRKDGIAISISDKGIGIEKENQKLVFKNLFRVHTGDVHNVKGFGIGLFYVKKIVEMHGGKITLQSEPNKGSTFEVFLPFKNELKNEKHEHIDS
ncbi:MAG: HAMP domain-containing sensor histidine kinase [Bacteroidales bacterium]|nr:HAMP domain-containing sensor histidine kinase [Bacteroidales bacterium]